MWKYENVKMTGQLVEINLSTTFHRYPQRRNGYYKMYTPTLF